MPPKEMPSTGESDGESVAGIYGHIFEGVTGEPSRASRGTIVARYRRRLNLAALNVVPEGFEVPTGNPNEGLIVLTPPHLIATENEDGTWTRRARVPSEDGPAPYTLAWYQEYLRYYGLPSWFLRLEHTQMLDNDREARELGVDNTPDPINPEEPDSDFPADYYNTEPVYMNPSRLPEVTGEAYAIDLDAQQFQHLARLVPATRVHADLGNHRVVVTGTGYITLRSPSEMDVGILTNPDMPTVRTSILWQPATEANILASYHQRSENARRAEANNGFVDLNQVPNGTGQWQWLNGNEDRDLAHRLGLELPVDVQRAREFGLLQPGQGPHTVFTPTAAHFNPIQQPQGEGRWEFFTTNGEDSDRAVARTRFPVNYWDPQAPSAGLIWQYRVRNQRDIAAGTIQPDEDDTAGIDLVWIPADSDPLPRSMRTQPTFLPRTNPSQPRSSQPPPASSQPEIRNWGIDRNSRLPHDPRNGGVNDQTGIAGTARYQTRDFSNYGRGVFTVDRSRARPGQPEPHKGYVCTKTGQFKQWGQYSTLDWNDKVAVEKLNKWREQLYQRNQWPTKREDKREKYELEQLKYLFKKHVQPSKGEKGNVGMEALREEFNKKFNTKRCVAGITAIMSRLRKEYAENNGQMKPRKEDEDDEVEFEGDNMAVENDDAQHQDAQTADADEDDKTNGETQNEGDEDEDKDEAEEEDDEDSAEKLVAATADAGDDSDATEEVNN